MKHFELNGTVREVGGKPAIKAIRKQGLVPCNLYGQGMENVLFTVSDKDLQGITNTPASFIIDFLAVSEDKPIAIKIPIVVSGHPVGVQRGGKFVLVSRFVKISALMKDLPDTIDIDVTPLDIEKRIVAGDIKVEGVSVVSPKDTIICTVKATRNMSAQVADEGAESAE